MSKELGPLGLGGVRIRQSQSTESFYVSVSYDGDKGHAAAIIPAATLEALVYAVTTKDSTQARRWMDTLTTCINDLRRIGGI